MKYMEERIDPIRNMKMKVKAVIPVVTLTTTMTIIWRKSYPKAEEAEVELSWMMTSWRSQKKWEEV